MANWQEKEKRVNERITQRESNLRQKKQLEIDDILKTYSVKEVLDNMRVSLWKEGEIREVTGKEKDGFDYRTGYELITKVPIVLPYKTEVIESIWVQNVSLSDQVMSGGGYDRRIVGYEDGAIGADDIGVIFKITVGKELESSSGPSQLGTPATYYFREDTYLYVEDTPFVKPLPFIENDDLKEFGWGTENKRFSSTFYCMNEDLSKTKIYHKFRIRPYDSWEKFMLKQGKEKDTRFEDFEEFIVKQANHRKDTNNLPFQIREKTNEFKAYHIEKLRKKI